MANIIGRIIRVLALRQHLPLPPADGARDLKFRRRHRPPEPCGTRLTDLYRLVHVSKNDLHRCLAYLLSREVVTRDADGRFWLTVPQGRRNASLSKYYRLYDGIPDGIPDAKIPTGVENPVERRIIRALERSGGSLTQRELMRKASYQHYGAEAFYEVLERLVEDSVVKVTPGKQANSRVIKLA